MNEERNLYDLCNPYSNAKLNFILPTWSWSESDTKCSMLG
jgi:hypothetical protein